MGTNKYAKKKKSYKDRARLLTEAERKVILDGYDNRNNTHLLIVLIIMLAVLAIFSAMWGVLWGVKEGVICFGVVTAFSGAVVILHLATLRMVVKKVRGNKMYAVDAVYDRKTVGKYNHVYLKSYKKPYAGYDLLLREPLKKGDRVIVLQMWGQAWVYKARN